MENLDALIKQLERHEGFVAEAYQDSLGYWTIGIGRLIDKRKGGKISKSEAYYLLRNDISEVCEALDRNIPWWKNLSPARQQVLANMAFNLGVAGLLKFTNTLGQIQQGNYNAAANMMLQSRWAKQVGQRAVELSDMMRVG